MKKRINKVKQVTSYKAVISRTEKEIEAVEAAKVEMFHKFEKEYESMTDFMDMSKTAFVAIVKTIKNEMIFEKLAIEAIVKPYGEITEIGYSVEPFNLDKEILLALRTESMAEDKLRYILLKRQLAHETEALSKVERIQELLIKFDSAKIKLIEIFPQMAKFNNGIN